MPADDRPSSPSSGVSPADVPGPLPRCRICQGLGFKCEQPNSTCRFATTARAWLEQWAPAGPDDQLDIPALAVLLRSTEEGAIEHLSAARTKRMSYLDDLLERFRDVVDDVYGMQPVLDWAGLIDVVEAEGNRRHLRMQWLADAVVDLVRLVPPDRLRVAKGKTLEMAASLGETPFTSKSEEPK